jgi:hypothetical protein
MAGPEGERTAQNPSQPEHTQPQPGSTLSRAVERTRALYERNGWVFLPLGEVGEHSLGVPTLQGEQQPHGGGINKPELHPPKEMSLPFEPNLPSQKQQLNNLDPEVERLMREYAESEAEGDQKKADRLFNRYMRNSSLIEFFKDFKLRGAPTFTSSSPDFSALEKKPKKQE